MSGSTTIRLGINGFGRIGRMLVRATIRKCSEKPAPLEAIPKVVAINDPLLSPEQMAYLLKYDTIYRHFPGDITVIGSSIKIDGQVIEVSGEKEPTKIPWKRSCTNYVIDCSRYNTTCDQAAGHLSGGGVKRVILTAPSKDAPAFVVGVNHGAYSTSMNVITMSTASTNCLAPLIKVLEDSFGIEEGFITVITSVTSKQNCVDGHGQVWKEGRNSLFNLIPTHTRSVQELGKIFSCLNGKLAGVAVKTPLSVGMLCDFTTKLSKAVSLDQLKCKIRQATDAHMKGILAYNEDKIVLGDVIGVRTSSIFDGDACASIGNCAFKLLVWSDNEWAYACRVIDMLKYVASRETCDK